MTVERRYGLYSSPSYGEEIRREPKFKAAEAHRQETTGPPNSDTKALCIRPMRGTSHETPHKIFTCIEIILCFSVVQEDDLGVPKMHCTKCGTNVPDEAAFCPGCGAAVTQPQSSTLSVTPASPPPGTLTKKSNKLVGCIVFVVVIFVLLALIGQCAQKVAGPAGTATASSSGGGTPETGQVPLAVTAQELFNSYQANEASAQGYFGGRPLLVSGTVKKVSLDFMNNPIVELETPNEFMPAHAALADDAKGDASNFSPGDNVKLLCEDVSEIISTPMLKNCRIAPTGLVGEAINWKK